MNHKNYNNVLVLGVIIVILFFVSFRLVNQSIERQLAVQLNKVKKELLREQSVEQPQREEKKQKRLLVPSDLTPYKIVQQRKSKLFKNQQYWDVMTRNMLQESDILSGIQQQEMSMGVVKTPQEYKKRIQAIDGRIRKYKRRLRIDPSDDYARRKLQDMYMSKSAIKILREKAASHN